MNYYIPVTDWPDWLMSDDYHGNDLQTPKPSVVVGGEAAGKMAEHTCVQGTQVNKRL